MILKVYISENQRGFLFRHGIFIKMLAPGKHKVNIFMGESYITTDVGQAVDIRQVDISVLLRDSAFAESIVKIEVPDLHIALHYVDGCMAGVLKPGIHYFWNVFHKHTGELVDMRQPEIRLAKETMYLIPIAYYTKAEVAEGETGLLFFDGEFQRELKSGCYYFWKNAIKVTCQSVDMRTQQLDVNSQEILTADKVTLRLNFVCTYRITNAVNIHMALKDYKTQIYVITQLAIREYVGRLKFDELLEQKEQIAEIVLENLRQKQDGLFVEFLDAGLKDIILPGEIRDIMNTVLIAEKNAQANVISRREEVASTRSLLNTAKLMEENTTLYKLKELEYLEKICDKVGSISVGNGNLLGELGNLLSVR